MSEELKPCPFCGAMLIYAAPVTFVHPVGKCILSGRNFAKGVIGQWNKRAPIKAAPADTLAAALRRIHDKRCEMDMGDLSADEAITEADDIATAALAAWEARK